MTTKREPSIEQPEPYATAVLDAIQLRTANPNCEELIVDAIVDKVATGDWSVEELPRMQRMKVFLSDEELAAIYDRALDRDFDVGRVKQIFDANCNNKTLFSVNKARKFRTTIIEKNSDFDCEFASCICGCIIGHFIYICLTESGYSFWIDPRVQ